MLKGPKITAGVGVTVELALGAARPQLTGRAVSSHNHMPGSPASHLQSANVTVTLPAQDLTPPTWAHCGVGRGTSGRARLACQRTSLDDHRPSLKSHDLGVGKGPGLHQEEHQFKPSAQRTC